MGGGTPALYSLSDEATKFPIKDRRSFQRLTWLEGRPIAELDDGTVVTLDTAGEVLITPAG